MTSKPYVIFDLDGVLIDSSRLIRMAYRLAGVDPPHDILAQEGVPWIAQQVGINRVPFVKREKAAYYLTGIREGIATTTEAYIAACALRWTHNVGVMSGAPPGTLRLLRIHQCSANWPFAIQHDNVRTEQKMKLIRVLGGNGVYIDDQQHDIDLPPGWSFIHYTGQGRYELIEEVDRALVRGRNFA